MNIRRLLPVVGLLAALVIATSAAPAQAKMCHVAKSSSLYYLKTAHVKCANGKQLAGKWVNKKSCNPILPGNPGWPGPKPNGDRLTYYPKCRVKHFRCSSKPVDYVSYRVKCREGRKGVRFRIDSSVVP